jgi:soluble lytic murein transglycosylase
LPALRRAALWLTLGWLLANRVLGAESVAPSDAPAVVRQSFILALQRVRVHQPDLTDPASLQSYVIHDYLVAARLRRDLALRADDRLDAAIDTFLRTHDGEPVARALRHDWLASLAQRSRWDWFLPRSVDAVDPQFICDRLKGRLDTQDTAGLAADALARWILPQKQPPECAAVFAWLRTHGLLTAALAESRTRAALSADNARLAREFAADMPVAHAAPLLLWSDLLDSPKSALSRLAAHPSLPVEPEALAAGFDKLARSDFQDAYSLLPKLLARENLSASLRGRLRRSAALGAAYDRDARAPAAFDTLGPDELDLLAQEWRARAAIWSGDYAKVLQCIEQMPQSLAAQPRWRYWRARAVAATTGEDAAAPLYAEIAGMRDYYGYLAADRLDRDYDLNVHPAPDDPAVQATLAATPGLLRAHALFDCDMTDDAIAEWTSVLGGSDAATKVQAAHLAAQWGWYSESISMLAQAGEFDEVPLRYPRPYLGAVADGAKRAQLPADWILAIMRQESLFRKDAVSRADARGAMQMLPSTAIAVARRWHMDPPGRDSLFDPAVAIPLGAVYLRELLDRYHEQLALTFAAYNAGPAAVARWLPPRSVDADVWIENIPFNETRGYVQHLLEHIVAFAAMRGAEPPRLNILLAPVEPPQPFL